MLITEGLRREVLGRLPILGLERPKALDDQPLGENELPHLRYLDLLNTPDWLMIQNVLHFSSKLADKMPDIRFGVIGIGSLVKPEGMRDHPIEDIDLKILHSTHPHSMTRYSTMLNIQDELAGYLTQQRIPFNESDFTVSRSKRWIESTGYANEDEIRAEFPEAPPDLNESDRTAWEIHRQVGITMARLNRGRRVTRRTLAPWEDYNQDPSFHIPVDDGLPLHITIAGQNAYDLDLHLYQERKQGAYFSLLMYNSKPTADLEEKDDDNLISQTAIELGFLSGLAGVSVAGLKVGIGGLIVGGISGQIISRKQSHY